MKAMSLKRRRSTTRLKTTRVILNDRCDGICEICGTELGQADGAWFFEIHHRKRRSQGGTDGPENTAAAHPGCHTTTPWSIHQNPTFSISQGWIVERHADPATTVMRYMGSRDVFLLPDGSVSDA